MLKKQKSTNEHSTELILIQKELDLQLSNLKNTELQKQNLEKAVFDLRIQQKNEIELVKNKFKKDFDKQLEDEK